MTGMETKRARGSLNAQLTRWFVSFAELSCFQFSDRFCVPAVGTVLGGGHYVSCHVMIMMMMSVDETVRVSVCHTTLFTRLWDTFTPQTYSIDTL